ncbi:NAD(P)/FAD-dependent oxidoreductase [Bacillus sp. OK048]|uniref:NAD(P)/FAD-dependent oxidoreductase n=1 Tax=Bacillus sp. OK048 TaxID=1882761 RepID=UPI00087E32EB|nr:NAD(P)/FAD-dependent oxidoreductase [Bacillus sp. OK048]SDM40622.1 thioredoxin reductase (NADPH) [Bacillus sp. OK048]
MNQQLYDITVIGGGPTGLFTAFYAGMRQCTVKIIESMPQLGGQLAALYPEKYIYDVAGFPHIRAQGLVNNLINQMEPFQPSIRLEEQVIKIHRQKDGTFLISTNKGNHFSRAIIITAGVGAFKPRSFEPINAKRFEGTNLHYFIKDLNLFNNKKVIVLGGGDSAVDWALALEPIAKEVNLVHRRDKFRAHESSVTRLKNSRVNILTPFTIKSVIGSERIEKIVIENIHTSKDIALDADDVIVNFGFVSSLGPINEWGIKLKKGSILVNTKMETNIPGIYAAGDVTSYPGKVKLITVGFGEGPIAVNNAKTYFDPSAKLQPGHSTSMNLGNEPLETMNV